MDKTRMKHEASKGKDNNYTEKGNKREKESRKKQADMIARSKIKARQGRMGCHIKHANSRW
jgi:hypothetical protein